VRARVRVLAGPCRCGCKGRDSWHRETYLRTLRDEHEESGTAWLNARPLSAEQRPYDRVATVRLPWGDARAVRVVEGLPDDSGRTFVVGWFLAFDDEP
jgi:hypothetical protein